MRTTRSVHFKISDVDGLGQGVSKVTDKITFIPKTLPGEEGEAEILSERKGVAFAALRSVRHPSPKRIDPACPHFSSCPSCHFLHTDYASELQFKRQALERIFRKIPHPEIAVIGAPDRLGYRNRIQLHYDLRSRKLGMQQSTGEIVEVPLCAIGNPTVAATLRDLYQDRRWEAEARKQKPSGHVEIYDSPSGLKVSWNRPYADGGFTQVYAAMNEALKTDLVAELSNHAVGLLDLFAGNGNLSEKINHSKRLCVDVYREPKQSPFFSQDLYDARALSRVKAEVARQGLEPELLVVDPPRSGLRDLRSWLAEFSPARVAYVSCDPNTLGRDLAELSGYTVIRLRLYDFFPATHHFETLAILERK